LVIGQAHLELDTRPLSIVNEARHGKWKSG